MTRDPGASSHGLRLARFNFSDQNFGDALNAWLLPRLAPGLCDPDGDDLLLGIGSILGGAVAPAREIVVYSAGAGYGPVGAIARDARLRVACVRGPLTASVLGLNPSFGIGDAGMLAIAYCPRPEKRKAIALAPHWQSMASQDWSQIADDCGFDLIDMRDPVERVLERLGQAQLVIAEALHAAILADAMDIPWIPFASNGDINRFKWADWTSAMQTPYRPVIVPPPWDLQARSGFVRAPIGTAEPFTPDMAIRDFQRHHGASFALTKNWTRKWRKGRAKRAVNRPDHEAHASSRRGVMIDILHAASSGTSYLSDLRVRARSCDALLTSLDRLAQRYGARVDNPKSVACPSLLC